MTALFISLALIGAFCIGVSVHNENNAEKMRKEAIDLKLLGSRTASPIPGRKSRAVNLEYPSRCFRFAVSEDGKTAYLRNGPKNPSVAVPASSITGCGVFKDPVPVKNLGRTILGGMIAGGMGAVVAGNTGRQSRNTVRMVVFMNDPSRPRFEYRLLDGHVAYSRSQYEEAMKYAEDVSAAVKALKASEKT